VLTAEKVKQKGKELGADLVGICSAQTINKNPPDLKVPQIPANISPEMKSLVAIVKRIPAGAFRAKSMACVHHLDQLVLREHDKIAYRIARYLEQEGSYAFQTAAQETSWEMKHGSYGYLSTRHVAIEAGLGTLGLELNLMTREFGPRCYTTCILTTAELEPDAKMTEQVCIGETCSRCLYACPSSAVLHWGIDKRACATVAQEFGVASLFKVFERFITAVASLGNYAYLFIFLLLSLPVLSGPFRHIVILIIIPFSVLWALFLSYEYRNLAIAFPLIALCAGVAVEKWVDRIRVAAPGRRKIEFPAYAALLIGLLALGLMTLKVNGEQLVSRQLTQQRQIFEAELNDKLYRYFSRTNGPEPVISSYPIGWLPGLEGYWRLERFKDYDSYQHSLVRYADAELLLFRSDADERILKEIQQKIEEGIYMPIFQEGAYSLVRIPPRE